MSGHSVVAGAGLVLSFILVLPAGAQTAVQPVSSGAVLHVETRRVVEDVTVTDSHGKPVQDLTQSEFRIFENGAEQKIVSFDEHRQAAAAPVALPSLPTNTFSNLSEPKTPGPLNIILYDLLSTAPACAMASTISTPGIIG